MAKFPTRVFLNPLSLFCGRRAFSGKSPICGKGWARDSEVTPRSRTNSKSGSEPSPRCSLLIFILPVRPLSQAKGSERTTHVGKRKLMSERYSTTGSGHQDEPPRRAVSWPRGWKRPARRLVDIWAPHRRRGKGPDPEAACPRCRRGDKDPSLGMAGRACQTSVVFFQGEVVQPGTSSALMIEIASRCRDMVCLVNVKWRILIDIIHGSSAPPLSSTSQHKRASPNKT